MWRWRGRNEDDFTALGLIGATPLSRCKCVTRITPAVFMRPPSVRARVHACVCVCVRPHAIFSSHSPFQVISLGSKLSLKVSLLFQSLSAQGCAWSTRVANTC